MFEQFIWWGTIGRGWNGTFINLKTGDFLLKDCEYEDIYMNNERYFIDTTIESGKKLEINNCNFTNCGENGRMIYIHSNSLSNDDVITVCVIDSIFKCCYCNEKGGIFYLYHQRTEFINCIFNNISSLDDGGIFRFFFFFYFYF
jgi:hypothetical protein